MDNDHIDLQAEADWPLRAARNILLALLIALLVGGAWTAGNMTLDAAQRQIEAGAVEW
jgi:hypothetical protein